MPPLSQREGETSTYDHDGRVIVCHVLRTLYVGGLSRDTTEGHCVACVVGMGGV